VPLNVLRDCITLIRARSLIELILCAFEFGSDLFLIPMYVI